MEYGPQEQSLYDVSTIPGPVKGWLLQLHHKHPPTGCSEQDALILIDVRDNLFACALASLTTLSSAGKVNIGQGIAFVGRFMEAFDNAANALLLDKTSAPFNGPPPARNEAAPRPPATQGN
jgi:hypothetical protein